MKYIGAFLIGAILANLAYRLYLTAYWVRYALVNIQGGVN